MAFYRIHNNEYLKKSEKYVFGPNFQLVADLHEQYKYPVEGWHWFETDEEASSSLGFSLKIENKPTNPVFKLK